MKPEISIIVPVYKVEKYLNKCVDSILNQTFKDFELILVDDGSPDNCGKICDEYAHKDSRVKVIHKENGGQSSARNAGLDIAQGEYIGFVDSDDWIEPDMYELLYQAIKQNKAEVALCGVNSVRDKEVIKNYPNKKVEKEIIIGKNNIVDTFYRKGKIGANVWNKLYKKSSIENIKFLEGRIYEDIVFNVECFNKIESCVIIDKRLYNYYCQNISTTRSYLSKKTVTAVENAIYSYEKTDERYKDDPLYSIVYTSLWICTTIVNEKRILKNRETFTELKKVLKENKKVIDKVLYKKKYEKLMFQILKISPMGFAIIYRIGKEIKKCLMFQR